MDFEIFRGLSKSRDNHRPRTGRVEMNFQFIGHCDDGGLTE